MLIPTLMFHSVSDEIEGKNVITTSRFSEQLIALLSSGYRTITLEEYAQSVKNGERCCQEKRVLLTFDDGYEDFYTNVWPILEKLDATATVFLLTSYIGQLNWWNCKSTYFRRHLSWEQVVTLKKRGISFGGHSTNHHSLVKFDKGYIWYDMTINKTEIEHWLDAPLVAFCYPYGDFNQAAKESASLLFDIAFSVTQGTYDYRVEPYAINRFDAQHVKYTPEHLVEILDSFSMGNRLV